MKTKKIISFMMLLVLIIAAVGCSSQIAIGKQVPTGIQLSVQAGLEVNTLEENTQEVITLNKSQEDKMKMEGIDGKSFIEFTVEYPQVENPIINEQIEAFAKKIKLEFSEKYGMKEKAIKENSLKKENNSEDASVHLKLTATSHLVGEDKICIVFHERQETMETYVPTYKTHIFYFNKNTGALLEESVFFNNDEKKENEFKELISSYMIQHFSEEDHEINRIFGNYKDLLLVENGLLDDFMVMETGIRFYFDTFELFPASVGVVQVDISFEELEILKQEQELEALREKEKLEAIEKQQKEEAEELKKKQEAEQLKKEQEAEELEKKEEELKEEELKKEALEIDPNKPMVALTFDDGPHPIHTNKILDTLEKNEVVATFFDLGKLIEKYPEVVQRQDALGCEVGSHSYAHDNFDKLTPKEIKEDVAKTENAFQEAISHSPTLFRPPYGNANKQVQSNVPLTLVNWSVDTLDWKSKDVDAIMDIIYNEADLDGKVILMHGIYETSAEATEVLIPYLLEEGYQLVTVTQLLEHKFGEDLKVGDLYGYMELK